MFKPECKFINDVRRDSNRFAIEANRMETMRCQLHDIFFPARNKQGIAFTG